MRVCEDKIKMRLKREREKKIKDGKSPLREKSKKATQEGIYQHDEKVIHLQL